MISQASKTFLFALLIFGSTVYAKVTVPGIFSDNAVLQRSAKTAVFGKAAPGEKVTVTYGKAKASAVTGKDGKWLVRLDLSKCDGKAKDLVIQGSSRIVAKNVITGEVWFCTGQSNMAMTLSGCLDAKKVISSSANTAIRTFVARLSAPAEPADDIQGRWLIAGPETSGRFPAAGYYFARRINQETGRAVGLVSAAWGGCSIEAWVSAGTLCSSSDAKVARYAKNDLDYFVNYDAHRSRYMKKLASWLQMVKWCDSDRVVLPANNAVWQTVPVSKRILKGSGIVWFRKEIEIAKKSARNGKIRFRFGLSPVPVQVFIDGRPVGGLELKKSLEAGSWDLFVPEKFASPGKHVLTLRYYGFMSYIYAPRLYRIGFRGGFSHDWQSFREKDFPALSKKQQAAMPRFPGPRPAGFQTVGMIWNGLVHPIIPYTMKGALWYQGEYNANRYSFLYEGQLRDLVKDMRKSFGDPDFRFYTVQLPGFKAKNSDPNRTGNWVSIRASQAKAMTMPHTGLAVTVDLGESADIHPIDKQPVGERLAAIALHNDYGRKNVSWRSPEAVKAERRGSSVIIFFKHADGGLKAHKLEDFYWINHTKNLKAKLVRNTPDSRLEGFALCGKDGRWFWADAKIEGDNVTVFSAKVKEPAAVRYAWQDNPTCNLFNGAGLPAGPFELKIK